MRKNVVLLKNTKRMKNIFFLLLTFLSIKSAIAQELSADDFKQDLKFLKDSLPNKHKNLFAKISKEDFTKKIDEIEMRSNSLDYDIFSTELLKLIVAIEDEHTRIWPSYKYIFPIKLSSFKEGLFVTQVDSSLSKLLLAQLIAMNNYPIHEVVNKFRAVVQSENKSFFDIGFLQLLNKPTVLKGLGITNNTQEINLTFKTVNGNTETIILRSIMANDPLTPVKPPQFGSLLAYKQNRNYWFDYNKENETIYFKYAKCQEDPSYPFDKFSADFFNEIQAKNPKKIIIDLRDNSGGNSGILTPFITKLQSSYLNKKGKLFVLIGKSTFSSALMNAVKLKRSTQAKLIGQTTSGNINHYGEVRGFDLPKTKISVTYSTKYWENWKGKNGPLVPDHDITYSIENFKNGIDEALEYIYKGK